MLPATRALCCHHALSSWVHLKLSQPIRQSFSSPRNVVSDVEALIVHRRSFHALSSAARKGAVAQCRSTSWRNNRRPCDGQSYRCCVCGQDVWRPRCAVLKAISRWTSYSEQRTITSSPFYREFQARRTSLRTQRSTHASLKVDVLINSSFSYLTKRFIFYDT